MYKKRVLQADCGTLGRNVANSVGWHFKLPPWGNIPFDNTGLQHWKSLATLTPYVPPNFLGVEELTTQGRTRLERLKRTRWSNTIQEPRIMKDCIHRAIRCINYDVSFLFANPDDAMYTYYAYKRLPFLYANNIGNSDLLFPVYDLSSASGRAWWTMQPRFEGEVQMLNFIFELKDFRDICKHILKLASLHWFSDFLDRLKGSLRRCFDEPTKTAATLNLVNSFAIQPLLADLHNICGMMMSLVTDVQNLFGECGSNYQKKHYAEKISEIGAYQDAKKIDPSLEFLQYGTVNTSTFNATLRYKYQYTMRPFWEAFVKYWGYDLSFEAIWNAIPFSFLVDYWFKIGKAVHAMEVDPNTMLTDYEYCESLKQEAVRGFVTSGSSQKIPALEINGHSCAINLQSGLPVCGYFGTNYFRYVTNPNRYGLYIPKTALPTGQQWANMASLLRCFL